MGRSALDLDLLVQAVTKTHLGELGDAWSFGFLDTALAVNFGSYSKLAVLSMPALVRGALKVLLLNPHIAATAATHSPSWVVSC